MLSLLSVAFAQEPQTFSPQIADVEIGGVVYSGILVDEGTYTELGELRVLKRVHEAQLSAHEEWETWYRRHSNELIDTMRDGCEANQVRLTAHYEQLLQREKRRDFFQQQGFALGVAAGLVGATAVYLGAVHLYDGVILQN